MILVGHSAGGLSVTHALHVFGNKIKVAIFVAATMLPWGYQTEEDIKDVTFLPSSVQLDVNNCVIIIS